MEPMALQGLEVRQRRSRKGDQEEEQEGVMQTKRRLIAPDSIMNSSKIKPENQPLD